MPDVLSPPSSASCPQTTRSARFWKAAAEPTVAADLLLVAIFACMAFLVLGYHPYAEDGGLYAATLAAKLDPTLFAHDRAWVTGHTRFSLFVPAVAALLQGLHLPLPTGLLLLQGASLLATAAALLQLARLCFVSADVARWATLLVMLAAGLPIAGTSLNLVDPCLTARSVTTPLLLLSLSACLRRRWAASTALWTAALAFHPLMAAWGGLPLALFWLLDRAMHRDPLLVRSSTGPLRELRPVLLPVTVLLLSFGVVFATSPIADPLHRALAQTRGYWFLSQWHWYELAGIVLPLLLLAGALRFPVVRIGWRPVARPLALTLALSAIVGLVLAALFARANGRTMAIARLQPLRTLHLFYAAFLLLFAGTLVAFLQQRAACRRTAASTQRDWHPLHQHTQNIADAAPASFRLFSSVTPQSHAVQLPRLRPANLPVHWQLRIGAVLLVAAIATPLVLMQRSLYPSSGYFELPGRPPQNGWEQAFAWAREHSDKRDLFAVDANYTISPGEDAQGFRAIALRSVLPDRAKDGGVAAMVPALVNAWQAGSQAQTGLESANDTERRRRLLPLGADWLIVPAASITSLRCPYRNAVAKVCRLR